MHYDTPAENKRDNRLSPITLRAWNQGDAPTVETVCWGVWRQGIGARLREKVYDKMSAEFPRNRKSVRKEAKGPRPLAFSPNPCPRPSATPLSGFAFRAANSETVGYRVPFPNRPQECVPAARGALNAPKRLREAVSIRIPKSLALRLSSGPKQSG
ncbi:unnamed protein product [Bursaphelenchus okinawaensis]|uniref:Uncharacterized protein n=1 Tax=Bursaphelenchus okinawaensis TaxID=465554 RepID=A0A811LN79_9BILA|nr:unnamed protein product [Bursaphelenchus okinawaensis]CAG9125832.1 unnamed protein product [Bursaphelenchus okinawaensis]